MQSLAGVPEGGTVAAPGRLTEPERDITPDDPSVRTASMAARDVLAIALAIAQLAGGLLPAPTHAQVLEEQPKLPRQTGAAVVDDPPGLPPARAVQKTADQQIRRSLKQPWQPVGKQPRGQVVTSSRQKMAAARASTTILDASPGKRKTLPARRRGRPTVALALGGGGVRGAAHVGVLKVLAREHIPIDYVVGTSMGAIVGGLYCAGVPLSRIEQIETDGSLRKAYAPDPLAVKVAVNPLWKVRHPRMKRYAGIWSGGRFEKFLVGQLPPAVKNVEDTRIPFAAVATNLVDGKAYLISEGSLSTAIRASSTITPVLQPVAMGDKVFVDGGMRDNLPCSAARATGAGLVIAVVVDDPLKSVPVREFRHFKGIAQRLTDIMVDTADERQLPYADIVIRPDVSGIPIIARNRRDAAIAVKAGEDAARRALPEIKRRLQSNPSRAK